MFVVLVRETVVTCFLSIFAVFLVVLIITGSLFISGLSVFSVFLVELFIIAIIPMSDLTFNNLSVVHLLASLGLSVLYSVHISHRYLLVEAPNLPKPRQRVFKARVAMSRIGSSVLHGSISTLLALIIVGASARSYYFIVFFRLWLGIVLVGMANAFILVPIILSFIGPTPNYEEKNENRKRTFEKRRSSMSQQ